MLGKIRIQRETAKALTLTQELNLVRTAFAASPSPVLRTRLARLLLTSDAFDELIDLLGAAGDLQFFEEMALTEAYLARENPADTVRAGDTARRAVACARTTQEKAEALAALGKAQQRLGDKSTRQTLEAALQLDPRNKNACKRIAAVDLAAGDVDAVLATMDSLAAQGAAHARLFAARTLAHARRGDIDSARGAASFDEFHCQRDLEPPPGWGDIHAFNRALALELVAHPGLRYERYGSASERTWRIDAPAKRGASLFTLLLDQISAAIEQQIGGLRPDHPWAAARPADAVLRSWCVLTESEGFETWHVHQFGWLSGVYYVQVPDSIAKGNSEAGCLAFGLPEDLAGERAASAYGRHLVRPREGLMLSFPSHAYHRTFPHGGREKRICVAFDLRPI